jgi:Protein of unknown function (DUF4239)
MMSMPVDLSAFDYYLFAALAVVGSFVGAWLLIWLSQSSPFTSLIDSCRGVAPNFLSVIGVMFSLNLVFLANDTWHARDRALDAVYQEADSLSAILVLAGQLPEPTRLKVAAAVRQYAQATVTADWPALARGRSSPEAAAHLDALLVLLSAPEVGQALYQNQSVYGQMLHEALQVRAARNVRIAVSQTHVNPLKWLGMAFLGFLMMTSIVVVHVDAGRPELMAIAIFVAAAVPTAAIVLIQGNPFQAPSIVSAAPIATLSRP